MFRGMMSGLLTAAVVLAGCAGEEPGPGGAAAGGEGESLRRIVILTNGDDPFWDACEAGAMAAEEEFNAAQLGYDVVFERANFTVERQVEMLRGYRLAGDVAGVGVSVVDPEANAIANELRDLREAGIAVVTIDGDVDRELHRDVRFAYLGTENLTAGRELGKAAAALQPEGGQSATFVGKKSAANAVARISGFIEGAGESIEHIETLADESDQAIARDRVRAALQQHEDLDTLVGIWAYNTPACVAVAEEMGVLGRVNIYSVDAAELTIRAMEEGKVQAMVVQNPFNMGKLGVKLLLALAEGDDDVVASMYPDLDAPDGDLLSTGLKAVVPEGSPLTKEVFAEETEFLSLPEFQAWLEKYGLKSS